MEELLLVVDMMKSLGKELRVWSVWFRMCGLMVRETSEEASLLKTDWSMQSSRELAQPPVTSGRVAREDEP